MRRIDVVMMLLLTVLVTGCSSKLERHLALYDRHYVDYINIQEAKSIMVNNPADYSCVVNKTGDIVKASKRLAEEGYILVGDFEFNGRGAQHLPYVQAHCETKDAEFGIYSWKLINSYEMTVPITTPQVSYAQTTYQGQLGNYSGSSTTTFTQYVQRNIPVRINTFRNWATYWVKAKPPVLGAYYGELTDTVKYESETNSGAYVYLIVKNTPAFKNNVIIGDVIVKVDDIKVITPEDLTRILGEKAGKEVDLHIIRKGEPKTMRFELNHSPSSDS